MLALPSLGLVQDIGEDQVRPQVHEGLVGVEESHWSDTSPNIYVLNIPLGPSLGNDALSRGPGPCLG